MSSCSGRNQLKAGYTILETLIVLTIVSLLVVTVTSTEFGPSEGLQSRQRQANAIALLADLRTRAVSEHKAIQLQDSIELCDPVPEEIRFDKFGSLNTEQVCILIEGTEATVSIDPITGLVTEDQNE